MPPRTSAVPVDDVPTSLARSAAGETSYDEGSPAPAVRAWRPGVDGLVEVFHARFTDHAYPPHTHDAWTLLIVDDGAIRYDLDRHHHGALGSTVTLLPPHVPHDGRSATAHGFRKRVLYLDSTVLDDNLVGPAVDHPELDDALLRHRIDQLHQCLDHPGDTFEAESRLALVRERLLLHLRPLSAAGGTVDNARVGSGFASHWTLSSAYGTASSSGRAATLSSGSGSTGARLADGLRDLLDSRITRSVSLRDAATELHAHPAHLIRSFTAAFGIPPHQYVTGRRVDLARRLLLAGQRPADVAVAAGFFDQPHLNRHFKRYLGTTPGRYATSGDPQRIAGPHPR